MNDRPQTRLVESAIPLIIALLSGCLGGGSSDQSSGFFNPPVELTEPLITLSWDSNPESDGVIGYFIYYGASADAATQLISDLPITNPDFNASSPQMQYSALLDFGVESGRILCFRVKAYNITSISEFSEAACAEI